MAAAETSAAVSGGAATTLAPALVGALVAVAVGPKTITRNEVFLRLLVALGLSHLFGKAAVSYVASLGLAWFNPSTHDISIYGLIGCFGWGLMGGLQVISQRFRRNPLKTAGDLRKFWRE